MTEALEINLAQSGNQSEMFGFAKDETTKAIALNDLSQSVRVEGKFGKSLRTRPVQSWYVLQLMHELLESQKINYNAGEIYVQKNNSHIMINDNERNLGFNKESCPINRWLFDKILSIVHIPGIGNQFANAGIAFGFNDNGIELAFGLNVHICRNFSIMGGRIMRSYKLGSYEATPWELMEHRLKTWMNELEQNCKVEVEIMNRMKSINVPENTTDRIIGKLYQKAIDQAYFSKDFAPFNVHRMSDFVQEILRRRKEEEKIANVWDLYNWGTSQMKPGIFDLADINNASSEYSKFLCREFDIETMDLIAEAVTV